MKNAKLSFNQMSRRSFIRHTAALSAASFLPASLMSQSFKLTSPVVKGINLGVITYSFRSMPGSTDDLLGYLVTLGLNTTELMGGPIETYAGAPPAPSWQRKPSPEQREARKKWAEDMRKWRLSVPMDTFKTLRKQYEAEGVKIEIVKFPLNRMSDEEIAYCFKVAETLGAKGITLERSDKTVKKLSPYADKYKRLIGYHNHAKVAFDSWDEAVALSPYNAINLDVGHYVAGTNQSPIPLIKKYHDRILNLHLKDRKFNEGPNMPWGEGDTPLKEILQLLKQEKYEFMATIEQEYPIPEGSDAVKEVKKCIEFCREAVE